MPTLFKVVTDTSSVIAVVLNEPSKSKIITHTLTMDLIAPSSLQGEIGNALAAMLRRQRITLEQAQAAVTAYLQIGLRIVEIDLEVAMNLSSKLNIYAYDAYMLACALSENCPIITLDTGLIRAAKALGIEVLEI